MTLWTQSPVLVVRAPFMTMNPTLPQRVIDDAMKDDATRASAEYLAQFRTDIASLIDPTLMADTTRPKPKELESVSRTSYHAFVDPAGGGEDEFTIAIGHCEGDAVVLDLVRGLHGSPAQIAKEYSALMLSYGSFNNHVCATNSLFVPKDRNTGEVIVDKLGIRRLK